MTIQKLFILDQPITTKTTGIKPQQIEWISNLRVKALFLVIILHASSPLLMDMKAPVGNWLAADFYNALSRFAVPVFVMITGALLFNKEYELGSFLKRKLSRIIWPFLFWSLVFIGYGWYDEELNFNNDFWHNTMLVLQQLKYGAYYHLWYVYMLIGLYLIIPILSKFVRNATEREIQYFLLVWFIVIAFSQPYLAHFWPQVDVRYFTGYIGYLVLGYYLATKPIPQSGLQAPLWIFYLVCLASITLGTYFISESTHSLSTIMYEPLGPFIILYSAGIFLLARATPYQAPRWLVGIRDIAGNYSLGIYLCHALFLTLLDDWGISYKLCNPFLSIPVTALVCFVLSFALIFILGKIPIVGKYLAG
ncbi:MAG TPA: acyltransferase family protein [Mucilaginibacter sp.]|nr:acyltransferase family protein [Mucilaginibacter sp.]